MIKRETEPTWHLSPEQIARLAESGTSEPEQEPAVEHLSTCRRCFGMYSELARQRIAWLSGEASSTSEYERLAMSVAQTSTGQDTRPWRWSLAWIPAVGVAVLAAAWLAVSVGDGSRPVSSDPLHAALVGALEAASSRSLVYPGGEAGADAVFGRLRSGTSDRSVQPSLDALSAEYLQGDPDEATFFWLTAGYLADGQRQSARTFLEQARREYPDSDRLQILDAIRAYQDDSAEESIRLLEGVVTRSPHDAVARFNLGCVLVEEGYPHGREHLTEIEREVPHTPLGRRATAELAKLRD